MKKAALLSFIIFIIFIASSCVQSLSKPNPVEFFEYFGEEDQDEIILENEYLSLHFMPETLGFVLIDKETGMEWHSNPLDPDSDHLATGDNTRKMMRSQFALLYDDRATVGISLFSHEHGKERKAYDFEKIGNDTLEVSYTIGDVPRLYILPTVLPEDRMDYLLSLMDDWHQTDAKSNYELIDINNLLEHRKDSRDQLLSEYPDLENMNMYVMYEANKKNSGSMEVLEDYFADVGYTYEDYLEDSERYGSKIKKEDPLFSMTVRYTLDGKSLVVNIPYDRIGYYSKYPVTQLTVLPYFGSGNVDDDGYMLVPDGSGALIRFNNRKNNQDEYSVNVYGYDVASQPRDAILTNDKAPFPVFGIYKEDTAQQKQGTLFCVIEEGASYASIRADVSGQNRSSWNKVYPVFDVVHWAKLNIAERSQQAFYLYESNLPAGESITMRYILCDEPGYNGMAKEYRSWLLKKYPNLGSNPVTGNNIPVAVELIGAVNKTQHRLGLPFDLSLRLTSYNEMNKIVNDFADFGWKNVQIKLGGWFNRSIEHTVPTSLKLINVLGNKNSFMQIISTAEKHNYNVYPEVDFMYMRDVGLFSGFSLNRDAARYVNRERVQSYPYSFVWFGERKQWGKLNYLARPEATMRIIDNFMKKASNLGIKNIAFRNMGSNLAGDYHERRRVSREASKKMRQDKFMQLDKAGTKMLVSAGFDYALPWVSIVTDMAINDQSFGITDTAVPFYQMVLHGLVPYTGKAINLAEDYTKNLLRIIESGAGLYFSFIAEETSVLQETKFRQFYANEYDKWVKDANELYKQFSRDFGHLYRQRIVNHKIISKDVTVTEYEDGTLVVVNASDNPYDYEGQVIMPNTKDSYIVVKQGPAR